MTTTYAPLVIVRGAEHRPLGDGRGRVLREIARAWGERGYAPSIREVMEAGGFASASTVHSHVQSLEALQLVETDPGVARSMRVTSRGAALLEHGHLYEVVHRDGGWPEGVEG